jgi:hypothetical protein
VADGPTEAGLQDILQTSVKKPLRGSPCSVYTVDSDASLQAGWGELGQGCIGHCPLLPDPTREHGKLRYSPRDLAIARLVRRLMDAGVGVEGVAMLKRLAERDVRRSAASGDETALVEAARRILYQRKAFREETGMDEERYPEGRPPPPPGPSGDPQPGPKAHGGPRGPKHGPRP